MLPDDPLKTSHEPGARKGPAGARPVTRSGVRVAMPLDGGITDLPLDRQPGEGASPDVHYGAHVGEALQAIREYQRRNLEELAETTRVRRSYLAAIEANRLELLPSRPFTIGYIRAYAEALGVDPDEATYRFKAEEPILDEPLKAPVGVQEERDPRLSALFAGGIVILLAIILWNIAQRALSAAAPPPPTASEQATAQALRQMKPEPIVLGEPLPPPVESTTPPPYQTPGLEMPGDAPKAAKPTTGATPATQTADIGVLAPTFTPAGTIYGAAANQPSFATLQALKPASIVIRGVDGSVYFARQLDKGEAYRIPAVNGLVVDASDNLAFQVFVAGQSKGYLPAAQSAAAKLGG